MIARSSLFFLFGATLAFGLTNVRDAEACGGCFHPEPTVIRTGTETTSVITDHRMVFKVSQNETILWDQVRYTGAPDEFAWVLPVREGAKVELSRDEFIASLDAMTKTTVKGPTRVCTPPGGSPSSSNFSRGGDTESSGCGSSSESDFAAAPRSENASGGGGGFDAGGENEKVDVVSQEVIGPYQAVTLHAKNGEGITEWLTQAKFQIPENVKPTIEAYTKEGFDFIALRLRPGTGVQAMRPVRVVTPGADTTLPLRMVAAGIGARVGLTLWVIAEGRYQAQNFANGTVEETALRWDAKASKSNLGQLESDILSGNGGRTWLTEAASTQSFDGSYVDSTIGAALGTKPQSLYQAYMRSCALLPPREEPCNPSDLPDNDDGAQGTTDAGAPTSDAGTDAGSTKPPPNKCMRLVSGCDGYDDLEVASRGLYGGSAWVTRLRADLPAAALSDDFRISATTQTPVASAHTTNTYLDPNDDPCPDGVLRSTSSSSSSSSSSGSNAAPPPADDSGCTCRVQKKSTPGTWLLIGVTAFIAARIARQRKR
jgi:hypothetical protein